MFFVKHVALVFLHCDSMKKQSHPSSLCHQGIVEICVRQSVQEAVRFEPRLQGKRCENGTSSKGEKLALFKYLFGRWLQYLIKYLLQQCLV